MASRLETLIIDESALHEDALADALERWIHLTREGGLVFRPAAADLGARKKVLLAALASAALHKLGIRANATVTPKEVGSLTGLPGGTVRPALKELAAQRLLRAQGDGYVVPSYALESVRQALA